MPARLKLFRTPIGFYDAYVAAPSRRAALAAWGSEKNLFASGRAELVEDGSLIPSAFEKPGEVIRVRRGTDAENIAALPRGPSRRDPGSQPKPATVAAPRPSRVALDEAEEAVRIAEQERADALTRLDKQIGELEAKRKLSARRHDQLVEQKRRACEAQARDHAEALKAWRDQ